MKALKIVLVAFALVVGLSASAFAASIYGAELCWNLDDGKSGEVYFLRVGVMDFGGGHYSLAGKKTVLTRAGATSAIQLVNGNLEYVDSAYEIGLNASDAITGTNTLMTEDLHMVLDSSFNGWYFRLNGAERRFTGMATFVQCP